MKLKVRLGSVLTWGCSLRTRSQWLMKLKVRLGSVLAWGCSWRAKSQWLTKLKVRLGSVLAWGCSWRAKSQWLTKSKVRLGSVLMWVLEELGHSGLSPFLTGWSVCSPDILQTVWWTMICFLIELLVRQTCSDSSTNYTLFLTGLLWDASFGPNLWHTHSRQHDPNCRLKSSRVKSVYFNHPSQGNSANNYVTLGPRDKSGSQRQVCASHKLTSEESEAPSNTFIHFYFYFFLIHRRALLSANQRQGLSN